MFKTGEKVYYPGYGKAIIEAIEEREVMGVVRPYYILKGVEREVTILIPEDMIHLAGLRRGPWKKSCPASQ